MDSVNRNIKVRTDGDILRDAFLITCFDVDGSEYSLYTIDRNDGVRDNIMIDKLTEERTMFESKKKVKKKE